MALLKAATGKLLWRGSPASWAISRAARCNTRIGVPACQKDAPTAATIQYSYTLARSSSLPFPLILVSHLNWGAGVFLPRPSGSSLGYSTISATGGFSVPSGHRCWPFPVGQGRSTQHGLVETAATLHSSRIVLRAHRRTLWCSGLLEALLKRAGALAIASLSTQAVPLQLRYHSY